LGIEWEETIEETFPIFVWEKDMSIDVEIFDEIFTFIHPDNEDFWGVGGIVAFNEKLKHNNSNKTPMICADGSVLDFDSNGEAVQPLIIFQLSRLIEEGKTLMAHVVVELGVFDSVGQAKKNGWNRPVELGEFELKKKHIKFTIDA